MDYKYFGSARRFFCVTRFIPLGVEFTKIILRKEFLSDNLLGTLIPNFCPISAMVTALHYNLISVIRNGLSLLYVGTDYYYFI